MVEWGSTDNVLGIILITCGAIFIASGANQDSWDKWIIIVLGFLVQVIGVHLAARKLVNHPVKRAATAAANASADRSPRV